MLLATPFAGGWPHPFPSSPSFLLVCKQFAIAAEYSNAVGTVHWDGWLECSRCKFPGENDLIVHTSLVPNYVLLI